MISSPVLSKEKVDYFVSLIKSKQEQGIEIRIVCASWNIKNSNTTMKLAYELNHIGIETLVKEDMKSCFAVIDDDLVWYGSMNLLGKVDYYDNLMRLESKDTAAELLESIVTSE